MQKRKCAVCGDLVQSNVKLLWKRDSDQVVFHICMLCAESGKVNKDSVKMQSLKTYTTYQVGDSIPVYESLPSRPFTKGKKATRLK